ncbi:MAG TPA: HD-GYP domain-containing protein [Syntrophales bacterium]|nr:HD-GYP domain-containing protein [Syntrophales bacterium]
MQNVEQFRKAVRTTLQTMAAAVEARDHYMVGHQRRVTNLACAIATEMNLSSRRINGISTAGMIHDIGKIAIPEAILSKPTKLAEEEFIMIKTHPQVGYEMLKEIEFPWPVAQIILQHHERMDGSGYPHGLAGEEILLEARILAVADVLEAISSNRPYRPAHSIDIALEENSRNSGILYDKEVVDACLRIFCEKGYNMQE